MILINEDIHIPNAWEELTPQQACDTVELTERFIKGSITLEQFRVKLLTKLSGYAPNKKTLGRMTDDQLKLVQENFFILSEQMRFPIKPHVTTPEILSVLDDDLQKALKTRFPFEINEVEWVDQLGMIKNMISVEPRLNLDIKRVLIPSIDVDGLTFYGPEFDIDKNGIVTTNIVAGEYVDAYEFFNLFNVTRDDTYLDTFVAILYRQNRGDYSTYNAQKHALIFKDVSSVVKKTVYIWFQSLLEYLSTKSPYVWLFIRKSTHESAYMPGMGNTIYSMAGKGYGNKKEVEMFPLPDYFAIMLRELVENVQAMKDMEMKMHDIVAKTGLPSEVIAKI